MTVVLLRHALVAIACQTPGGALAILNATLMRHVLEDHANHSMPRILLEVVTGVMSMHNVLSMKSAKIIIAFAAKRENA